MSLEMLIVNALTIVIYKEQTGHVASIRYNRSGNIGKQRYK